MAFAIPTVAAGVYLALFAIALLACAAPLLVLRRDGASRTARNMVLAAILILPLTGGLGYTMTDNELRLEDGKLVLHAAHFYEQARPLGEFDLARARAGTLASIPEARLGVRSNGISLPGYAAGRFAGREGAVFALLTDRSRVVWLPAKAGPSLLISVARPEAFLAALRADSGPASD
jgi:hypothetical protein